MRFPYRGFLPGFSIISKPNTDHLWFFSCRRSVCLTLNHHELPVPGFLKQRFRAMRRVWIMGTGSLPPATRENCSVFSDGCLMPWVGQFVFLQAREGKPGGAASFLWRNL